MNRDFEILVSTALVGLSAATLGNENEEKLGEVTSQDVDDFIKAIISKDVRELFEIPPNLSALDEDIYYIKRLLSAIKNVNAKLQRL